LDGILEEKNRGFKANTLVSFIQLYSKAFRHINWKKITKFYFYGTENCTMLFRDLLRLLWADPRNLVFFWLQSPPGNCSRHGTDVLWPMTPQYPDYW
jgi:hypothetical protein